MSAEKGAQAEARGPDTLALPPGAAKALGLEPGARLDVVVRRGRLEVLGNLHSLAKVYVEPSSRCNLSCRTCLHRTWDEAQGDMSPAVFAKLVSDLRAFPHLDTVMLGGFGEPTVHPDLLAMLDALKALGVRVEMVTNGTLLDDRMLVGLRAGGLDRLWVSFDGAEGPSFEHVRQGASFAGVVRSLKRLRAMSQDRGPQVKVGLAVVVMRDNISDLKGLGKLARVVGADRVSVSNVIPYSPELDRQMVCGQALTLGTFAAGLDRPEIDLPRLDAGEATKEPLWSVLSGSQSVSVMGNALGARVDECRFVRERCCFIRWDGEVAPCMGLMHGHSTFFRGYERKNRRHCFGDILRRGLRDIWDSADYAAFREKVAAFDFSPCHICGGCGLVDSNSADCAGSAFPASCGGCLWAQGIIQCP